MKTFSQIINYMLPVLYLLVIFVYYRIFFKKDKNLGRVTRYILPVLLLIQAAEILIRLIALNAMPLSTLFDALSFLTFSILLVYYIIELTMNHKASGLFILSFAFFLVVYSSFNHSWEPETNDLLKDPMFILHASLNLIGYTALSLSALYALMFILQNRNMKKHKFNILFDQMLPLDYLQNMSIRSVVIGITLLGIGLLLGHYHAYNIFGKFWFNDPKVIVSDFIWFFYFVGYMGSRKLKLPARYMSYISLYGFLGLLFGGTLIINMAETFHKFY